MDLLVLLLAATAGNRSPPSSPCNVFLSTSVHGGCYKWDLSTVPAMTYTLNTSTCPKNCNSFLISSPCRVASSKSCSGAAATPAAAAYQVLHPENDCDALSDGVADGSAAMLDGGAGGLYLRYTGGVQGRQFNYNLLCNDNDQGGPDAGIGIVESPALAYTVTWSHKAFCPTKTAGSCPPSPVPPGPPAPGPGPTPGPVPPSPWGDVPLPTAPQLAYYQSEVRALVHFNMATFIKDGDPGCSADNWNTKRPYAAGMSSDPATFNPSKLNFSNWLESFRAVGITNAVMTAKHGCGHLLWPTNVTLPGGLEYTFCVGKEKSAIKYSVAGEFAKFMTANNVKYGFYYSLTNNFYMNVAGKVAKGDSGWLPGMAKGVTQDEFERIAWEQLTELWTQFGSFSEVWLDGGYPLDMLDEMKPKLPLWQPDAVAWNGLGSYESTTDTSLSKSPVRWVGTESGLPGNGKPVDIWSTASQTGDYSGLGNPNSPVFAPPGCDTVLQVHGWFYTPGKSVRTLADMQTVYHSTVGRNCVIELDFAIDREGLVDPVHAARYAEFGAWIHNCYGPAPNFTSQAVASTSGVQIEGNSTSNNNSMMMTVSAGQSIDRVIIQEEIEHGQRIRAYTVEALIASNSVGVEEEKGASGSNSGYNGSSGTGSWITVSSGYSVGNKRIDIFAKAVTTTMLRLNVTANKASPVHIKLFGAYTGKGC